MATAYLYGLTFKLFTHHSISCVILLAHTVAFYTFSIITTLGFTVLYVEMSLMQYRL